MAPRDELREIAREKSGHVCDVVWLAEPRQVIRFGILHHFRVGRIPAHLRFCNDVTRADAIHANASPPVVDGHYLGEGDHTAFRRGVTVEAGLGQKSRRNWSY